MNAITVYLRKWNFLRFLQFALGLFIAIDGFHYQQWPIVIVGGILAILPVFNIGCRKSACCRSDFQIDDKN